MTCIYKLIEGLVPDSAGAQTPLTKSRADTITSPNEIKPEKQSYHCNCSIRRIADCLLTQLLLVQRSGFHGGSEAAPQVRKLTPGNHGIGPSQSVPHMSESAGNGRGKGKPRASRTRVAN